MTNSERRTLRKAANLLQRLLDEPADTLQITAQEPPPLTTRPWNGLETAGERKLRETAERREAFAKQAAEAAADASV